MVSCRAVLALTCLSSCILAKDPCSPCVCHEGVADCSHRGISEVPSTLPENINNLDLSHNNIREVKAGALRNFSQLQFLDLSFNNLETLHNESFQGLKNLTKMYLNHNRLNYLPSIFPPAVFKPLVGLLRLWLHNNIDFGDNDVMAYPDEALSSLTSLVELRLDGLEILELGLGFSRMRNLSSLSLSKGKCVTTNLTRSSFENVPGLQKLSVANCTLKHIDKDAFTPLSHLRKLNMSYNEFLTLHGAGESFYGLQNSSLESLDISQVETTFHIGVVLRDENVRYLSKVPLRKLWMQSNRIQLIDEVVTERLPKTLEFVSMRDNDFTFGLYVFTFSKLTSVKTVDFSQQYQTHNPRFSVPREVGGVSHVPIILLPPNLMWVDASQSALKVSIPAVNFTANDVHFINLSYCIYYQWIGPLYGLEQLRVLDLSHNFCDTLGPHFFSVLPRLEVLNISFNYLGSALSAVAHTAFSELRSLRILRMADNKIRSLDENLFRNLDNLEELDLSNNELETWNPIITHMKSLHLLDLDHNFMEQIRPSLFQQLDAIAPQGRRELDVLFQDNSFYCTCLELLFFSWLVHKTSAVRVLGLDNATCVDEVAGTRSLDNPDEVEAHLQRACSNNAALFMAVLSAVVGMVLLVAAALIYRYRWKLRYLYYMARWKNQQEQRTAQDDFRYDAFISYADEDRSFVIKDMLKRLQEEAGLRLCIHHIHFRPGAPIAENILQAVRESRKTVVVLSPDFINSYWCDYEVQMAQMEEVYGRRSVLLVLLYRSVVRRRLSPTLLHVIRRDSYLEFPCDPACPSDLPDPQSLEVFWHNLKRAIKEDISP